MHTFDTQSGKGRRTSPGDAATFGRRRPRQHPATAPLPHTARTAGDAAARQAAGAGAGEGAAVLDRAAAPALGHALARIAVHPLPVGVIQTRLAVNRPGDEHEREAEHVADRVMSMVGAGNGTGSGSPSPGASGDRSGPGGERGGAAGGRRDDETDDGMDIGGASRIPAGSALFPSGSGRPLPASERAFMEPRFGHDFADVRVHIGPRAREMAGSLGARAFTLGNDIVFGRDGQPSASGADRRLLAHELTHVVQQRGGDLRYTISASDPDVAQRYLTGPPQRVDTTVTTPETYGNCRNYNLVISWDTDLRDGYIIQECINGDSITRCSDGQSLPAPNTPHYWEAWHVDASGNISDGNADTWFRSGRPGTRGWWTFDANVFAHAGALDPAWGFRRNSVPTAGSLLATTTGPDRDDLYQPSLTRHKGGTWDCCEGASTHVPR